MELELELGVGILSNSSLIPVRKCGVKIPKCNTKGLKEFWVLEWWKLENLRVRKAKGKGKGN